MTTTATPIRISATPGLGRTFAAARAGVGVSMRELSRRSGVSHSSISRWENGRTSVRGATYAHVTLALVDYAVERWAAS